MNDFYFLFCIKKMHLYNKLRPQCGFYLVGIGRGKGMSLNHQISCLFRENFLDEKVIAICGRCMTTTRRGKQDKTDIQKFSSNLQYMKLTQKIYSVLLKMSSFNEGKAFQKNVICVICKTMARRSKCRTKLISKSLVAIYSI